MSGGISMGTIFTTMAAGMASTMLSKALFKDDAPQQQQAAAAPAIAPPPVMPTPDDKTVADARRRSIAKSLQRRGRESTILSDPVTAGTDTLG